MLLMLLLASPLAAEQAPSPSPAGGVSALPPPEKPTPAYLLRHKLVVGRQERYRITLEGKGILSAAGKLLFPVTLGIGLLADQTVDSVSEEGSGSVTTRFTVTSARANGTEMSEAWRPLIISMVRGGLAPAKTTLTPTGPGSVEPTRGNLMSLHPSLEPGSLVRVAEGINFPEQAVKAGESWGMPAGAAAYCRTTLASVSTVKGRPVARLKQASAWPIQSDAPGTPFGSRPAVPVAGRQAADLDLRFDLDEGVLLSAAGSVDVSLTLSPDTPEAKHLLLKLDLRIARDEQAKTEPDTPRPSGRGR